MSIELNLNAYNVLNSKNEAEITVELVPTMPVNPWYVIYIYNETLQTIEYLMCRGPDVEINDNDSILTISNMRTTEFFVVNNKTDFLMDGTSIAETMKYNITNGVTTDNTEYPYKIGETEITSLKFDLSIDKIIINGTIEKSVITDGVTITNNGINLLNIVANNANSLNILKLNKIAKFTISNNIVLYFPCHSYYIYPSTYYEICMPMYYNNNLLFCKTDTSSISSSTSFTWMYNKYSNVEKTNAFTKLTTSQNCYLMYFNPNKDYSLNNESFINNTILLSSGGNSTVTYYDSTSKNTLKLDSLISLQYETGKLTCEVNGTEVNGTEVADKYKIVGDAIIKITSTDDTLTFVNATFTKPCVYSGIEPSGIKLVQKAGSTVNISDTISLASSNTLTINENTNFTVKNVSDCNDHLMLNIDNSPSYTTAANADYVINYDDPNKHANLTLVDGKTKYMSIKDPNAVYSEISTVCSPVQLLDNIANISNSNNSIADNTIRRISEIGKQITAINTGFVEAFDKNGGSIYTDICDDSAIDSLATRVKTIDTALKTGGSIYTDICDDSATDSLATRVKTIDTALKTATDGNATLYDKIVSMQTSLTNIYNYLTVNYGLNYRLTSETFSYETSYVDSSKYKYLICYFNEQKYYVYYVDASKRLTQEYTICTTFDKTLEIYKIVSYSDGKGYSLGKETTTIFSGNASTSYLSLTNGILRFSATQGSSTAPLAIPLTPTTLTNQTFLIGSSASYIETVTGYNITVNSTNFFLSPFILGEDNLHA